MRAVAEQKMQDLASAVNDILLADAVVPPSTRDSIRLHA